MRKILVSPEDRHTQTHNYADETNRITDEPDDLPIAVQAHPPAATKFCDLANSQKDQQTKSKDWADEFVA